MVSPFKAMVNLIKRFRRKRRLSSELDTRWGDPSISYPNQGSWNQWDQPSGFVANASIGSPRDIQTVETRQYVPLELTSSQNPGTSSDSGYQSFSAREDHAHEASVIPKGYFNENIRHRTGKSQRPAAKGLGIDGTTHEMDGSNGHTPPDDSCDDDEEEEGRDTLGDPGGSMVLRSPLTGDPLRYSPRDDQDPYFDRASKSPPLSVTQRMRRFSQQSSSTDPTSSVAGASSRRTSYTTAASSVSAPSLPPDTPHFAFNTGHAAHERRSAPRPKRREPEPTARQQMVPSYDELYG
ncbi:uncharacterized protein N7496_000673 [Penicillium cataractarum]|uniref:Uncharacterized protein n=1 Tax=Penicillium cataractarum TaxID=2100454 RepID=A0A9W9VUW1_9EURO|nr:uncharacterized protein N7496_000673 [Penicillium cataractarum]KAJ5389605.1 hypothetical protein N7496_000673 [Penicillium cataractarum]